MQCDTVALNHIHNLLGLYVLIHLYATCTGCFHPTSVQHVSVSSAQTAPQKPTMMTSSSRHNARPPVGAEWGQCVRSSEYAIPLWAQQQQWVQSQTNHSLRLSLALCLKEPNKRYDSFSGTDTICRYHSNEGYKKTAVCGTLRHKRKIGTGGQILQH